MTMTPTDALGLAARLHAGQVDKAGQPYLLHPVRVMMRLPADATDDEKVAALLHDTIEDCGETVESLVGAGVAPAAAAMVLSLTRRDGESYGDFLARVREERVAVRVKLADIDDNTDPARVAALAAIEPEKAQRLTAKYRDARDLLAPPAAA
jgi:(p)ppGpp synthase/HD superfamily hydrolase